MNSISGHYSVGDLGDRILAALEAAGKDPDALTIDDLAPVDQFHIRGRAATEELAAWSGVEPGHTLLDVGCGIGGTSRYLAQLAGCNAVGVDLTEEYCRVAEMLSARVGLAERTTFRHGSALDLPFGDSHFDIVWTEHVQMNIADKARFYAEAARVLKPGGRFAFHDVFAGEGALHFPVPWASHEGISHLATIDELEAHLRSAGLTAIRWEEKTDASTKFFETALARGPAPVGLHLLMGEDARTKFENVLRNLREGRVRVVQAVMQR